jgi:hypothetical protein
MSKIIPRETINYLKGVNNISIGAIGIDIDLYIPSNLGTIEAYDVYETPDDIEYIHYTCQAHIEWAPNIHRLEALGIYVENELPLIVWMPTEAVDDNGNLVKINILRKSYIKVDIAFIPTNTGFDGNEEFILTTPIIYNAHDAVAVERWKAVPRRIAS